MVVGVIVVEATLLLQPLLVVTTVGDIGTQDANEVNVVISDDDFNVSLVNKKGIDNEVVTSALVDVDPAKLVVDTNCVSQRS